MERVFASDGVMIKDISTSLISFNSFGDLVTTILKNSFVLASVICLVLLIFGGFGIIIGAGNGDTKRLEQSRQTIAGAVIGLIIVIGAFWIVEILATVTGVNLLSPTALP